MDFIPARQAIDAQRKTAELARMEANQPVKLKDQYLKSRWQMSGVDLMDKLDEAMRDNKANDAKNYAIAAAVATDKMLLLDGKPTSIQASIHEVRHTLPQLAGRLAAIAQRNGVVLEGEVVRPDDAAPSSRAQRG